MPMDAHVVTAGEPRLDFHRRQVWARRTRGPCARAVSAPVPARRVLERHFRLWRPAWL